MKTHYTVLGVSSDATHKVIQAAYYKAARKWHPDNHADSSSSESARADAAMRAANEAWSVLGDVEKRRTYDAGLEQSSADFSSRANVYATQDGITRIDPRLLNRDFLKKRRTDEEQELSNAHASVLRAVPLVAGIGVLLLLFVFSAYAGGGNESEPESEPTGPSLGGGIEVGDCVDIASGPSLINRECSATADGKIVGSRFFESGECPIVTTDELVLPNGRIACLGPLISE